MSELATIDALRFAQEHQRLVGSLPLAGMQRLSDVLLDTAGRADFKLTGGVDRNSKPTIEVEVEARLPMRCERCLDRLDFELKRSTRFLVVPDAEALPEFEDEETEIEAMPASALAGVADVIEQEILLGLPLAPMHADGACVAVSGAESEPKPSPFAALAALKTT